ncbi:hypothetical protein BGP77_11685 [Saccharospirillum sp. MSK14-1]|uniref:hypothetical protein n=1 Tax=Saccharospirillum sp. MSK14-1 TaxID=1897632 RepID=UPI000D3CCC9B|nr:hypothetical protein [Saccharospirillum sp. MSK14-1]PTY38537.1 hypothetical protein BGP77_11685 [Saccharospirillum sp. MSK14-1]
MTFKFNCISFFSTHLLFFSLCSLSFSADCDLIYDEFDSLMNKKFLINPEQFVSVKSHRLSRNDYNDQQKGIFMLSPERQELGVAIIHTNRNTWGKILFTWTGRDNPILVIKELVLFGRVQDGFRQTQKTDLKVSSSNTLDLDTGRSGGEGADLWFHNVNGREMYIEAINGATLKFPMESLCKTTTPTFTALKPAKPVLGQLQIAASNTEGEIPPQSKHIVARNLTADGHVLLTYSDGSKLELFDGGQTRISPDGSKQPMFFSTALPAAFPVDPPDVNEAYWLEIHRSELLDIIKTLVTDAATVDSLIEVFDVSENLYESINTRSVLIQRLVTP